MVDDEDIICQSLILQDDSFFKISFFEVNLALQFCTKRKQGKVAFPLLPRYNDWYEKR